jgi:N6-adenosine-specific RNA methylase IME4
MAQGLIRYDAACRAIAAARSVDEALKIRDQAEALRAYARIAKNKGLQVDAAEIRIRAERRVGEMVAAQKASVGLAKGGGTGANQHRRAATSKKEGAATLKDAGIDHKLSMRAQHLARVAPPKFERMLGQWRERISRETERVTTNLAREGERDQTRTVRPAKPLPAGAYRLIYADPPWRYEHIETESRAIENQYPTMSHEELCALRVPAAEDAVLFLWATSPKLAEAIRVLEAWGFSYRTCAVWDKERLGMGYYFRQQHELLLVAARGSLPVPEPSARPASVLRVKRGQHSAKPALVYELLESMYPAFTERDRIELFNRTDRPGWTAWGNEPAVAS